MCCCWRGEKLWRRKAWRLGVASGGINGGGDTSNVAWLAWEEEAVNDDSEISTRYDVSVI